jgi:low molecular weight protein-tyrosine phosphatase
MCRSPLAERLARRWLAGALMAGIDVSSAGTHAVAGAPMHPDSAAVLLRLGGDPAGFVARQLTERIADGADLILTAARAHREIVAGLCPRAAARTFTLREFAGLAGAVPPGDITRIDGVAARARALTAAAAALPHGQLAAWPPAAFDVADPVGRPMTAHEATARLIAEAIAGPLGLIAGTPGAFAVAAG